ncbi:MAG: hypothetical protein HY327_02700 [Chloroflexi bacterium]|nr:hypothetical protein [Chloroflexota bacterium]
MLGQIPSFFIALALAVALWAIATNEENPSREAFFSDPLAVEIVNRPEGLIVYEKSAETVRVKLRAPLASWDQMQPQSLRAIVDLKGTGIGETRGEVKVQVADPRVAVVAVEPPAILVRIDQLKSRGMAVETELLDAPPTGYVSKLPLTNPARVVLNGPARLIDQVERVEAALSVRGARSSVTQEISLTARDARGNAIRGVALEPAFATVIVPIEQRVGYKDVSIRTILKGAVAAGYWISNIVVAPSTATVVGSADVLARIPGFVETFPIDVNAATSDVVKTVPLALPEGVALPDTDGVTVQIAITPILGGQTIRRVVAAQGLRSGLSARVSPDSVEVILSGPLPVLATLTPQDVQVSVDVTGLASGTHSIKPRVAIVPALLKVQNLVPDTVLVNIVEATPSK